MEEVARLAAMNLLLHGVSGRIDGELPIVCGDSLSVPPRTQVDVVLTNPPFGMRGSVTYAARGRRTGKSSDELTIVRPDFWVETANKQLNFLQHVCGLLKPGGRAAVIIPDNVLFEGGAAASIRRRFLGTRNVHTLLRLPTGLFYAQGVKANVLFFDQQTTPAGVKMSRDIWVYDLRSDIRFTLKTKPLQRQDLTDFVRLYRPGDFAGRHAAKKKNGRSPRWRAFDKNKILATDGCSLDLMRHSDTMDERPVGLARLDEISQLISEDLMRALGHIVAVSSKN